jgi:GalNAc-alpha-(1->4)-GalNAc-alpha-(1->3)-diNAcBac-PP-undecaprenol alpha-1,4-N-acetyl-D-galactosaminyltransferase
MKLLFFISSLEDGGAQRVVSILSNKFVERGFEVEILKYYKGIDLYPLDNKVKVKSVEENTNTSNVLRNLKFIRSEFKDCDCILSFLAPFNMMAICANIFNKTPMIVADRNDPNKIPRNKFIRILRNILYKFSDRIVVQTSKNQEYFKSNTEVIYNPVVLNEYRGIALKTGKEKIMVSAARLEKQKNLEMLIDAFHIFHQKHGDYKLIIYGEGTHRETLERKIEELGMKDFILLPGVSNKLFDEISKAELFVLSSNYEGMPNALIEAMCLGLPCISTRVSGATDLIIDGVNGLLVDVGDTKDLTNKITKLIEDKEYAYKLANKAIEINDILDSNVICDKWLEMIYDVVK